MSDGLVARRYRLGRQLGSGGMGTVWQAYDEVLRRPVALKRIRLPHTASDEERDLLARRALAEATAAARLQHPSIVSVYDVVFDEDSPLIVMQLVEGRSLQQMVNEYGPGRPADAARIGIELLDALDTAHRAGILHRDVKPSNVMISGDGAVLLTDFSIAKVMDSPAVTTSGILMGSPGYIAPERVLGGTVGPPADLFGVGACLYYAVEGVGPFDREDAIAGMVASATVPHIPPAHAGPLARVIDGLLAKDPTTRWTVVDARRALHAIVRGEDDEVTVPTGAPWSSVATEVIRGATEAMPPPAIPHREPPTQIPTPAGPPSGPPFAAAPRPPAPAGGGNRTRIALLSVAIVVVLAIGVGVAVAALRKSPGSGPPQGLPSTSASASLPVVALPDGHGKTIRIWLSVDAKSWPDAVSAATSAFTAKTGAKVDVQYFDWPDHLAKLDAALGDGSAPDVVELGNTETPKYVFDGSLVDLTSRVTTFDNSATWLSGLADPCRDNGKTYCVPYYAGARVLLYRTDLFAGAGITPPTTYAELVADADKLKATYPDSSAFYLPGRYWYAAMSFVFGRGGAIATRSADGSWRGGLSSPPAEAGLADFAALARKYSIGSAALTEGNQDAVFASGSVAMMYGNEWEVGRVQSTKGSQVKGKVGAIALPGYTADRPMPSGLGGSSLAVLAKSGNQALAAEWIRDFTSTANEKRMAAKGALPNTTTLLGPGGPVTAVYTAESRAAMYSWSTPMSPHWVDVENAAIIQKMLQQIVGGADVDTAARAADAQIEKLLNSA